VKISYFEHIYDPTAVFRRNRTNLLMYTMVHQTSKCHIQAVMNNLKFMILDCLAAKKSGILE